MKYSITITDNCGILINFFSSNIKKIEQLSKDELEAGVLNIEASWHWDYNDTSFVYFGGVPNNLTEGDILTIFSQYGCPVYINMIRDRETGKSKGYGFLKYADQRSTVLAVDNLNGIEVLGRLLRVDHTRYELKTEDEDEFYEVSRLVQEATHSYSSKGEGINMSDGSIPRKNIKTGKIYDNNSDKKSHQVDDDSIDPMAEYLQAKKDTEASKRRRTK